MKSTVLVREFSGFSYMDSAGTRQLGEVEYLFSMLMVLGLLCDGLVS